MMIPNISGSIIPYHRQPTRVFEHCSTDMANVLSYATTKVKYTSRMDLGTLSGGLVVLNSCCPVLAVHLKMILHILVFVTDQLMTLESPPMGYMGYMGYMEYMGYIPLKTYIWVLTPLTNRRSASMKIVLASLRTIWFASQGWAGDLLSKIKSVAISGT